MIGTILKKILGTKNEREIKRISRIVDQINSLEPTVRRLSDQDLAAKSDGFKARLADGVGLEDILPEAFATARESARRFIGMRPFDVQLIGGVALFEGKIAEMKTGEGKTLVATLPAYLLGLTGRGVHIVTVNDYLAKRDAQWMGPLYLSLGLTVGTIQHESSSRLEWDDRRKGTVLLNPCPRREAYAADITFGQNNEFGFDYLRDNMVLDIKDRVQRKLHYAIVDEVDSILIDEARTPLIISGPSEESTDKYYHIDRITPKLKREADFQIDEKARSISLTEGGVAHVEQLLGVENLYDTRNIELIHHVNQALKSHHLFKRDVDYVVKNNQVIIVDEFTGRMMPGRRYSDGLHQALEAKEGVKIERENQTLATITFQNYFRMYDKLAGMTGTAETEATEFANIYDLEVLVIPPNRPLIRTNYPDTIYRTDQEKFQAAVDEIVDLYHNGRPVLVGTVSIEKSELLSAMLKRRGIRHHVLNAKHHEKEAEIVAKAGQRGAVTIATNMAGRGTDIILGPSISDLGGLHILGTERHESRRIDNQLRGRSGRQGDPGSSRFYLSLEDDLLRIFGGERIASLMTRLGMEEGQPIEHPWITKAIENAQKKVEAHNYDIRKHLLDYDDVMNQQREVTYNLRKQILEGTETRNIVGEMIEELISDRIEELTPSPRNPDTWDSQGIQDFFRSVFDIELTSDELAQFKEADILGDHLIQRATTRYRERETHLSPDQVRMMERMVILQVLDSQWKDHLLSMDGLKEGIGYRGYAQRNPLVEYKIEGFKLFAEAMNRVREDCLSYLFKIQVVTTPAAEVARSHFPPGEAVHQSYGYGLSDKEYFAASTQPAVATAAPPATVTTAEARRRVTTVRREGRKIGRNEPCPCGSGKKYKKCCGQNL